MSIFDVFSVEADCDEIRVCRDTIQGVVLAASNITSLDVFLTVKLICQNLPPMNSRSIIDIHL